jgi:large subunit ribosomal protein L2
VSYLPAEKSLRAGDFIHVNPQFLSIGSIYSLSQLPAGSKVFGVGLRLALAAGCSCVILKHDQETRKTLLKLPSGARKPFHSKELAILGESANPRHQLIKLGKAGRKRWQGFRPTVRGEAMNAVDHPHGGNSAGGGQPRTP